MKAIKLKAELDRLIRDFGENVEIEISVDVSTDDHDADARITARPIEIMNGIGKSPAMLLCEMTEDNRRSDK